MICIVWILILIALNGTSKSSRVSIPSHRVVVLGGGAAGYFAAIQCASTLKSSKIDTEVIIVEATKDVLQKVRVSGGGRCNVLHSPSKSVLEIVESYPRGKKELFGPYKTKFGPCEALSWFRERGLKLKEEADGRMFPASDKSSSVIDLFLKEADKVNVSVINGLKAISIQEIADKISNDRETLKFCITCTAPRNNNDTVNKLTDTELLCHSVIIATGSSRLGYEMAKSIGHSIVDPLPSLFSFKIPDQELNSLSGISVQCGKVKLKTLPGMKFRTFSGSQTEAEFRASLTQRGPILISKHGLTGPAVLKASSFGARLLAATKYQCEIEVSWMGELESRDVLHLLLRDKTRYPHRKIGKACPVVDPSLISSLLGDNPAYTDTYDMHVFMDSHLNSLKKNEITETSNKEPIEDRGSFETIIPRRLWNYLLKRAAINPELRWCDVSQNALESLAQEICHSSFHTSGRGMYRDEFVTCGGVNLKEIDMGTMESKKVSSVYFAGEILDIDGVTGGYNFQSAWTTGYIAGDSCAKAILN